LILSRSSIALIEPDADAAPEAVDFSLRIASAASAALIDPGMTDGFGGVLVAGMFSVRNLNGSISRAACKTGMNLLRISEDIAASSLCHSSWTSLITAAI
jgi:hypothetical protein